LILQTLNGKSATPTLIPIADRNLIDYPALFPRTAIAQNQLAPLTQPMLQPATIGNHQQVFPSRFAVCNSMSTGIQRPPVQDLSCSGAVATKFNFG